MKLQDSPIVVKMADDLGLKRRPNAEIAIRNYCRKRVESIIASFGKIKDLNQLLDVVSSHLRMKFEEIRDDADLFKITDKYTKKGELIFSRLHQELDEKTDGVLFRLNNSKKWEPVYAAVIDCRESKTWRTYFTKWHEVAHVLTTPPTQMKFQFRRIPVLKKAPGEQIVDRIAGDLAFYDDIFYPAVEKAVAETNGLTFSAVERLRSSICDGASREATLRGAIRQISSPQLFVIAGLGYKKEEERILNSGQKSLFKSNDSGIKPKLRALEVLASPKAGAIGFRIHKNMRVPERSIIFDTYEDQGNTGTVFSNSENLSWWEHSRGRLKAGKIYVEAKKSGEKVFALIAKV